MEHGIPLQWGRGTGMASQFPTLSTNFPSQQLTSIQDYEAQRERKRQWKQEVEKLKKKKIGSKGKDE